MKSSKTRTRWARFLSIAGQLVRFKVGSLRGSPAAYLADGDPEIDSFMESVGETAGGLRRISFARFWGPDFEQTSSVADQALSTAKKPAKRVLLSKLKRELYRRQYNWSRRLFQRNPSTAAIVWNGRTSTRLAFAKGARHSGAPTLFLERAPLPGKVTLDPKGINFANSVPRDLRFFMDWANEDPARATAEWKRLGTRLTARRSSRSDVTQASEPTLPSTPFLFCPLQVPGDTQIKQFSGWVESIDNQLDAMAKAAALLPENWHLRVKEHPSSRVAFGEKLGLLSDASDGRFVVDNASDTFAQVEASQGVVTVNSSVGLQAFFYDRPVLVLGQAFFGIEGLTTVAPSEEEMIDLFRDPTRLTFDSYARNCFMNWLDQVYYPDVVTLSDGRIEVDPTIVRQKLAQARALAAERQL